MSEPLAGWKVLCPDARDLVGRASGSSRRCTATTGTPLENATPDPVLTLDFVSCPNRGPAQPGALGRDRRRDALLAAGANRVWNGPDWAVRADPKGNEFCAFPARRDSTVPRARVLDGLPAWLDPATG